MTMALKTDTPATSGPLFSLGHLVATPQALHVLEAQGMSPLPLLMRHIQGDWGDLDPADVRANQDALQDGSRLLSSYALSGGVKVWVITEADRSVTTVLMPDEY